MTIKEIVSTASNILGRQDVYNHLNKTPSTDEDTLKTAETILNLINMVISELAGTFIPMIKKENVTSTTGKYYYSAFTQKPIEILGLYDADGNSINYEQTAEFVKIDNSSVVIEYSFIPPKYDMNSKVDYTDAQISSATLVYGLLAEYCIVIGGFDEAVMWHDRFIDGVKEKRKVKNASIKGRCWA